MGGGPGLRISTDAWSARSAASLCVYERRKTERGVLDFLDLLLRARNALRDQRGVRRWFGRRFRYLIIDEFQDTDPLQVEIARLLAGRPPGRRWWWWATPSSRSTASAAPRCGCSAS